MLIAHNNILNWTLHLMNEAPDFRKFYDPGDSMVTMDLKVLKITTTSATTKLDQVNKSLKNLGGKEKVFLKCLSKA